VSTGPGRQPGDAGAHPTWVWHRTALCAAALLQLGGACSSTCASPATAHHDAERALDVRDWQVMKRESGPTNYYTVVSDADGVYLHADYQPPEATTVLAVSVGDDGRRARQLRWAWRALVLPRGGNECLGGHGDSAAVVYVSWKRGLRWYTLKYAWSSEAAKGAVCDHKRNAFIAQDTVVLESGPPLGVWVEESLDLPAEFRRHFADGDPQAEVPDLQGVAVMTDGDQTASESAADYGRFVLVL
jgi:DUF3047 family protein